MRTIIFACIQNAGRSQMAAAIFNSLADPQRVRAISAGTKPARSVHPEVVEVLREIGIDLSAAKPQKLTSTLANSADTVITMGCGDQCPIVPEVTREDWPFPDPYGKPLAEVRQIRDAIAQRVRSLIENEGWSRPASRAV